MSAIKTRSHRFIFYLVNDRSPHPPKFPSVVRIDSERVFFNFNRFSYLSPCVMVNVGDDFGIFQEKVVFGGSGVFCKCIILYSSMSDVCFMLLQSCYYRTIDLSNIHLPAATWDRVHTFILFWVHLIFCVVQDSTQRVKM